MLLHIYRVYVISFENLWKLGHNIFSDFHIGGASCENQTFGCYIMLHNNVLNYVTPSGKFSVKLPWLFSLIALVWWFWSMYNYFFFLSIFYWNLWMNEWMNNVQWAIKTNWIMQGFKGSVFQMWHKFRGFFIYFLFFFIFVFWKIKNLS